MNITLPQLRKEKLLANDFFGADIDVYEVKKIDIHEDFNSINFQNDLAILTVAKPFDTKAKKGELQTESYEPKSKVLSNLVIVNNSDEPEPSWLEP